MTIFIVEALFILFIKKIYKKEKEKNLVKVCVSHFHFIESHAFARHTSIYRNGGLVQLNQDKGERLLFLFSELEKPIGPSSLPR